MKRAMGLEIQPYVGMGPVRLGMSRDEVRAVLPLRFDPITKGSSVMDYFYEGGIFVEYDKAGSCIAIEVGSPANPIFAGRSLFGMSFSRLKEWLESLGGDVVLDDTGLSDFTNGFGVYAPLYPEEPDEPAEGVIVFHRGYYDEG